MDIITQLKKHIIFSDLNDTELQSIQKITHIESFEKDQIVFYEGEMPNYFYLLSSGFAKIYKVDQKGNEIVLHNFIAPSLIAEMASIENFKFPATCIATNNCNFLLIQKEEFIHLLCQNSDISFNVIKSLTKKIKSMDNILNRSLIFDATTKVAHYINTDPNEFKNKKNKIIATELHITPETLSRVLKKLKELSIIDNDHNLLDQQKLQMFLSF